MKKSILISLLLTLNFSGYAQNQAGRGVEAPKNTDLKIQGKTYAILIGISDYKNVRKLQYADRDAEVFYGYLNEVAKVPKKNIFLFTNKNANLKNISRALTLLDTTVKIGDKVIFFFAGHGDIEAENRPDETALLLLHDSPNGNYLAAQDGYIKLIDLKDAFDKFTEKNVSVQFYADACRSGAFNLINNNYKTDTLKGGVRGKNRFLKGIQQPWLNQIKYVSCQVNENSLEGSEFSCGRGLFSLHLVDGLMGMADKNNDKTVSFKELQNYVEAKVTSQAQPRIQNPQKVNGNDIQKIAYIDSVAFLSYQAKQKQFERTHQGDCSPFISGINIKGDTISSNDIEPRFREDYVSFYKHLKSKNLLYPDKKNAKKSFENFTQKVGNAYPDDTNPLLSVVVGDMKADFTEALQDGCMKIIKPLLFEIDEYNPPKYAVYDTAHRYMTEALVLITKEHFLYNNYLARDLYLQMALTVIKSNNDYDLSDRSLFKADSLLKLALIYEPDMPYVYSNLGDLNGLLGNFEQALSYYKKGYELMPNSPTFLNSMATIYGSFGSVENIIPEMNKFRDDPSINEKLAEYYTKKNNLPQAKIHLEKALILYENKYKGIKPKQYYLSLTSLYKNCNYLDKSKIYADSCYYLDSTSIKGLLAQFIAKTNPNDFESVKPYVKKIVEYYPDFGLGHSINAVMLSVKEPVLAIQEAKISLKKTPNSYWGLFALTASLVAVDSAEQAFKYAKYATKLYPKAFQFWNLLGSSLINLKKYDDALGACMKSDSLNPNDKITLREIGKAYAGLGKYSKAIPYLVRSHQIRPNLIYTSFGLGICYFNIPNKLDSAIYFFRREIENNPSNLSSYVWLGLCYRKLGTSNDIAKALEYFKVATQKAKEVKNGKLMRDAYLHSLKLIKENKDFQENDIVSLQEITDLVDDKKSYESTNVEIVIFYNKKNQAIKTIPYLLKLWELNPSKKLYKTELFFSYFNTQQYKRANELLPVVDNLTDSASRKEMNGNFGIVKYRVKDYTHAAQYLQNAVRDTVNLLIYSSTLSRLQKFEDAQKILNPILKSKPSDLNYNLNYGFALTMQRKYSEAKEVFEKCEILFPKNQSVHFRWASFYAVQGQEKETYENMKKAFELGFKELWRFEDEEFDSIRDKNEFKELIKKYFQ